MFLTHALKDENKALTTLRRDIMLIEFRDRLRRCAPTLAQDAACVAALMVMLVVGLHLPMLL